MVGVFLALLLFSVAGHSVQAFKNDRIICEVSLVWDFDFKHPQQKREFMCEAVFAPDDVKEPPIFRHFL